MNKINITIQWKKDKPFFWNLAYRFLNEFEQCNIHQSGIKDFADYCDYYDKRRNLAHNPKYDTIAGKE